ncbi:MAG: tyrosine-type recombinase/integrase, partial [Mycobacterium sp.]
SRWLAQWYDLDGKRKGQSFKTKGAALEHLKGQTAILENQRRLTRRSLDLRRTFHDVCKQWLETRDKRSLLNDRQRMNSRLLPELGPLLLGEIDYATVERLKAAWPTETNSQKNTANRYLQLLGALLRYGHRLGWSLEVPLIEQYKLAEIPYRYLEHSDDIRVVLESARQEDKPLPFHLYATAVYTGMRAGELAGLSWSKVHLDKRLILVNRSFLGPPKGLKERWVPILDPLLPLLRFWRSKCPSEEWVFPNHRKAMFREANARVFQEVLHRVLKRAKLPKAITFHGFRHTFASHWVMEGGDLFKLQKILGHSKVDETLRYAHLAPTAFDRDWGRLPDCVSAQPSAEVLPITGSAQPG